MKELSIEEKAKLYDEAIERAYSLLNGERKGDAWIHKLLPELQESEDEKIRNEIIDYLERFIPHHEYDLVAKSRIWIDWLKKQGEKNELKKIEQKSAWSEGDEKILERLIKEKRYSYSTCEEDDDIKDQFGDELDFLVSLKERMTWRPTEKQMNALGDAVKLYKTTHFDSYHVWGKHIIYKLETLYNDLKKL